jgi:hypothetical protein
MLFVSKLYTKFHFGPYTNFDDKLVLKPSPKFHVSPTIMTLLVSCWGGQFLLMWIILRLFILGKKIKNLEKLKCSLFSTLSLSQSQSRSLLCSLSLSLICRCDLCICSSPNLDPQAGISTRFEAGWPWCPSNGINKDYGRL